LSVPPATIFAALVCALFRGTADVRVHLVADIARILSADRASARRRVTTIAHLVDKMCTDLRAFAKQHSAAFQKSRRPLWPAASARHLRRR
jgi:acyl transferase domain-containing protein